MRLGSRPPGALCGCIITTTLETTLIDQQRAGGRAQAKPTNKQTKGQRGRRNLENYSWTRMLTRSPTLGGWVASLGHCADLESGSPDSAGDSLDPCDGEFRVRWNPHVLILGTHTAPSS